MKSNREYIFNNKIIEGENISEAEATDLYDFLEDGHKIGESILELTKKELAKTAEDNYVIGKYNEYLKEEIESLELKFNPIPRDRIKFFNYEYYNEINGDGKSGGIFLPTKNLIMLQRMNGVRQYHNMMHEMIHCASFQKFTLNQEIYDNKRLGYHIQSDGEKEDKLLGFNEGVTRLLTQEILNKHKDELLNHLEGFKDKSPYGLLEGMNFFRGNHGEGAFVERLIITMDQKSRESKEGVWKKFKIGMLTGNMMHLRDIENIFGKKSLKILSEYGEEKRVNGLVYDYFFSTNQEKRNEIKEELFKN